MVERSQIGLRETGTRTGTDWYSSLTSSRWISTRNSLNGHFVYGGPHCGPVAGCICLVEMNCKYGDQVDMGKMNQVTMVATMGAHSAPSWA